MMRRKTAQFLLSALAGLWLAAAAPAAPEHASAPGEAKTDSAQPAKQQPVTPAAAENAPAPSPAPVPAAPPVIITTAYFPVLPYGGDEDTPPQLLPVAGNHALDGDHAGITRALIAIHDVSRDASGMLGMLTALAGARNETTIILAPQFLLQSDVAQSRGKMPAGSYGLAAWPLKATGSWEQGDDSAAPPGQRGVSSFTAIDLLLLYLGEKKFFPDLKDIVIAGFGAGGDFVQRYAATGQAPDLPGALPVRFVAADASSYLYFTPLRPQPGKPGFITPDAAKCPTYDAYKYGLQNLNPYARRLGANEIRLRYAARRIVYLAGERAAGNDLFPDLSCAGLLQGPDRLARAMNYDIYLNTIFGETIGSQKFATVPGAGYDAAALFGSRCGMDALFGGGTCAPEPVSAGVSGAENPE